MSDSHKRRQLITIMQFKTTCFFALFVNTTATGDIQTYNCGMSFVFLRNKST